MALLREANYFALGHLGSTLWKLGSNLELPIKSVLFSLLRWLPNIFKGRTILPNESYAQRKVVFILEAQFILYSYHTVRLSLGTIKLCDEPETLARGVGNANCSIRSAGFSPGCALPGEVLMQTDE